MIPYTLAFTVNNLNRKEVEGKNVLEVGSYNVNGSLRPVIEMRYPNQYIGTDFQKGPGVDEICTAGNLVKKFGKNSFDIVISSDTLEHILDWRNAISNIKRVCKINGILIISVPSIGFPYHSYPHDYWRFEVEDLEVIFSDFDLIKIESSYPYPGVVLKAKKPLNFIETITENIPLYSIVAEKRIVNIFPKENEISNNKKTRNNNALEL